MHLPWINTTVTTTSDLLWYLHNNPPPNSSSNLRSQPPSLSLPALSQTSSEDETIFTPRRLEGPTGQPLVLLPASEEPTLHNARNSQPPSVLSAQRQKSTLFAIIIGINNYASPKLQPYKLEGAVADAEDMRSFLTQSLGVPELQITVLHDERATKQAIEDAIADLESDPRIHKGDPILIYYAGHGAQTIAPPDWPTDGPLIQMIIPHDFDPDSTDSSKGQPILDLDLARLLDNLAEKKGDNITVILDCCHSVSGTRGHQNDASFKVRGLRLPQGYKLDASLFSRGNAVPKNLEHKGLYSHTLFAACMQGQAAREWKGRGAFTQALLKLWRELGVDRLTHKDTIERLPDLPLQNPQCEGPNQSRVLFNSRVSGQRRLFYQIGRSRAGGYVLKAGEAHDISTGAEFAVYSDRDEPRPLCTMRAVETVAFASRLELTDDSDPYSFDHNAPKFALQTRIGKAEDVRLFIEPNPKFLDVFIRIVHEMQMMETTRRQFVLVDSRDAQPDLVITLKNGNQAEFEIMDPMSRNAGLTRMPFSVPADPYTLHPLLCSASDFYWHLHRSNKATSIKLSLKIDFECFKLTKTGQYDERFREIWMPDPDGGNLQAGGLMTIYVDDEAIYGFKVTNKTNIPLYAALFYFDMSDLGIAIYYQPSPNKMGTVEPSLPPGGSLTIGYGSSDTNAYSYFIRPEQDVDVGYLKLYLSTEHVDYSHIPQPSPFEPRFASRGGETKAPKRVLWDTMTVAVIQRKRNP